jgi:hypothetical protein
MTAGRGKLLASTVVATAVAAVAVASTSAVTGMERPRGAFVDCSGVNGLPGVGLEDFKLPQSLVVGPLAVLGARPMLGFWNPYEKLCGWNKLLVLVKGGHRVTLELPEQTRQDARFDGFGRSRDTTRVVTFRACLSKAKPTRASLYFPRTDWPVSGWVGVLTARAPGCVPLLVWVDDEPSPRRTVIRFGVRNCDAPS